MSGIDISVVIPTCGRSKQLRQCLKALHEQSYPLKHIELIIVDDRTDNETEQVIRGFKAHFPQISYIAQYRKGPAIARNKGVNFSAGRIIAFIDDDCVAERDWIKKMLRAHDEHPEKAAVGGDTLVDSRKAHVLASQFLSTGSIETNIAGAEETIFFPTCNVSLKRAIFNDYKFNESFPLPGGEDLEFFWRLFKSGHRFVWDKNIKVTHCRSESLFSFIKQAYAYGRGNLLVKRLQADHPLLKELKTGTLSFWGSLGINFLKIPRFSYLLGKKLKRENNIKNILRSLSVNAAFIMHKWFYLAGNIAEYFRIRRFSLCLDHLAGKRPGLLIMDITHKCNLECRICDIWKTQNNEKDLEAQYIRQLLREARELNIPEIAFSGGEPLLRKDIFELFNYAQGLGIKNLGVLTNGVVIKGKLDKLTPYLIDNTISLVISLDSLKSDTHNFIRNSDEAWQKTTQGIKALSGLKEKYSNIEFHIISIILNRNVRELVALTNFARSLNASSLQFQALLANNLMMAERKESVFGVQEDNFSKLDAAIDKLIEMKRSDPSFIKNSENNLRLIKKYYRGSMGREPVACTSAGDTILVANQGVCTTCFSSYGNIKIKSLKKILTGQERIKAQQKVKKCAWPCLLPCFCDK